MMERYPISRGHVDCPRRGRIDVEVCFYCALCEEIDLDTRRPSIHCAPPQSDSPEERFAYEWLGVFELAEVLHNVRQACRERRVSKYQFYYFKKRYQQAGFTGLVSEFSKRKGDGSIGSG